MLAFSKWVMSLVTKTQIDEGDFTVVVSSAGSRKVRVAALAGAGSISQDVSSLAARVAAIENDAESISDEAAAAATSATSASSSATAAANSASSASTSASSASSAMSAASTSASTANTRAIAADASKTEAAGHAADASASATAAAASASSASSSATSAASGASTAVTAAALASTSETDAGNSAATASTKATEASAHATTASSAAATATAQATSASSSATAAAGSASTASAQAAVATTKAAEASASASGAATSAAAAAASAALAETKASEVAAVAATITAASSIHAATLSIMRGLPRPVPGTPGSQSLCYCAGRAARADGYEGFFEWVIGDQSANVSADSLGGVWVAPNSHATGSSGAWRRIVLDNTYRSHWFGDPAATDHSPHIQACANLAPSGAIIDTGTTRVNIAASVTISKDNTRLRSIYDITAATAISAYSVAPSTADQALTLSGASTIPAGSTSINVTNASGVSSNDMILLYSDDLLAATTYKKGEIVFVRSVAGNTITFQSATMHNLTTNVSVYFAKPVRGFEAEIDATSLVASNVLHNGVQLNRAIDSRIKARGRNVYNATVSLTAVVNSHVEYSGGNPGATTSNGFDYGVVLGNGCSNNSIVANGHNHRHVVACGATTLTGRNNKINAIGTDCKDSVVDSHPGFVDMDITFQAIGNRNGGSPAAQPVGCTVQCGGIVRIKGMCDGYDIAAVVVQPFQNTDDSFIIDATLANAGATATRGVNLDIQKIGGVINLIDVVVTGADAPGSSGWGIGLTTVSAYASLEVEKLSIRQSKCSGSQFAIGIQTALGNVFGHIDLSGLTCEAGTSKVVINNPGTIDKLSLSGSTIVGIDNSQKGLWVVGTGGTTAEARVTDNHFEGVAGNTSAIAVHCQQTPTATVGGTNRFKRIAAGASPNFNDYRPAFNAVTGDYRTNP